MPHLLRAPTVRTLGVQVQVQEWQPWGWDRGCPEALAALCHSSLGRGYRAPGVCVRMPSCCGRPDPFLAVLLARCRCHCPLPHGTTAPAAADPAPAYTSVPCQYFRLIPGFVLVSEPVDHTAQPTPRSEPVAEHPARGAEGTLSQWEAFNFAMPVPASPFLGTCWHLWPSTPPLLPVHWDMRAVPCCFARCVGRPLGCCHSQSSAPFVKRI